MSKRVRDSGKPYAGVTFVFCRRGPTACSACGKRVDEPLQLHVFTYKRFVRVNLFLESVKNVSRVQADKLCQAESQ